MKQSDNTCSGLCCVGGYWIKNYVKKIWQYKCAHDKVYFNDKAYFNVLFGSEYISKYIKYISMIKHISMLYLFGSEYIVNGYHI